MICQACLDIRLSIPLADPALRCPDCLLLHSFALRYQPNTPELINAIMAKRKQLAMQKTAKRSAAFEKRLLVIQAEKAERARKRLAPLIAVKRQALAFVIADFRERGLLPQRVRTRRWRLRDKRRAKRLA